MGPGIRKIIPKRIRDWTSQRRRLDRLTAFKWAERKSAIAKRERQKHVHGNPHTGYALK
jgi:hypothetical protein